MSYDIVFKGEVLDGFTEDGVKQEFARLFKQSAERVEKIFSVPSAVLKSGLDEAAAKRYREVLSDAGARIYISPELPAAGLQLSELETTQSNAAVEAPAASYAIANTGARIEASVAETSQAVAGTSQTVAGDGDRVNDADDVDAGGLKTLPFKFTGNGSEYFKIWIVNILLTIVTLGIYSAWAKVRNKRYFYSNTDLDGSRFEYLASPISILKGRLIAVAFFAIYTLAGNFFPPLGIALFLVLIVFLPWMVVRSLAFNARYSAYRNIRFNFKGDIKGALMAFIVWPVLGALTLGILMPLAVCKQHQFMINGYRYGTSEFEYHAGARDYYRIFLMLFGIGLLGGVLAGLVQATLPLLFGLIVLTMYLYLFAYFTVHIKNLNFNNATLGLNGFSARLQLNSYAWLLFTNTLFTVLTIGLYRPWAAVRTANYIAEHVSFEAQSDLDEFVADEQQQVSALGEELGEVFDFDFGL
ncbi:MAG: hypothetical protein AseanaTS_01940 [Candidatus Pelagadaptatus aseana]|uniref:YjgN family protein n=1 Tax=Candidatus Pelagadaptatus aseana TaxID=3120508 RepID=UPI0039B1BE96